jgi:hypothetical protein
MSESERKLRYIRELRVLAHPVRLRQALYDSAGPVGIDMLRKPAAAAPVGRFRLAFLGAVACCI